MIMSTFDWIYRNPWPSLVLFFTYVIINWQFWLERNSLLSILKLISTRRRNLENLQANGPPQVAEMLLALLAKRKYVDSLIIDFADRFDDQCRRFGIRRAKRLYWTEVIRTLWPLLRAFVRRYGMRAISWLGAAEMLFGFIKKLTH